MTTIISLKSSRITPFPTEVRGESHHRQQIADIVGDYDEYDGVNDDTQAASLILEGTTAVRIEIEEKTVGYLSNKDAQTYRSAITALGYPDAIAVCGASITGGFLKDDNQLADFGIRLDLDLEDLAIQPSSPSHNFPKMVEAVRESPTTRATPTPKPRSRLAPLLKWARRHPKLTLLLAFILSVIIYSIFTPT
jgi:hypothetical protein